MSEAQRPDLLFNIQSKIILFIRVAA